MKAIVTGGAGFVGSTLVKKINEKGITDIIIIDNYCEKKLKNLADLSFSNYVDYTDGIKALRDYLQGESNISAFFHIGANADVLETDAKKVMFQNFEYSKMYFEYCANNNIPFLYASTSAIYGNSRRFTVSPENEDPHNIYAWSKWLFDKYIMARLPLCKSKVVGLRLFNVFGMREMHKGKNACIANRFADFIQEKGYIDLFEEKIERDYIWAEDLAEIFYQAYTDINIRNGIYNAGGGNPLTHREIAEMVVDNYILGGVLKGSSHDFIREVPVPGELKNRLQYYTCAQEMLPFIAGIAADNKVKMNEYIKNLIAVHRK